MQTAMIFPMRIYTYTFYRGFCNFCCNVVPASTHPATTTLKFFVRSCICRLQDFHHHFFEKPIKTCKSIEKYFFDFLLCGAFTLHTKNNMVSYCYILSFQIPTKSQKIAKFAIFQRNSMVTWHREAQISSD